MLLSFLVRFFLVRDFWANDTDSHWIRSPHRHHDRHRIVGKAHSPH